VVREILAAPARLLHAQVQKAERQNLIASGELVPLVVMRASISDLIVQARQNLLQLPARNLRVSRAW
jgi:hypothetical protein